MPQTFLGLVELVPLAFQWPNASFGAPPLAAHLLPDSLGNRPRPLSFGLNAHRLDPFSCEPLAGGGRIATAVVHHHRGRRLLTKERPIPPKRLERPLPVVRIGCHALPKARAPAQAAAQLGSAPRRLLARLVAHHGSRLWHAHMDDCVRRPLPRRYPLHALPHQGLEHL